MRKFLFLISISGCLLISSCTDEELINREVDFIYFQTSSSIKDDLIKIVEPDKSRSDKDGIFVFYPLYMERLDLENSKTKLDYQTNKGTNYKKIKAVERGFKSFFETQFSDSINNLPANRDFSLDDLMSMQNVFVFSNATLEADSSYNKKKYTDIAELREDMTTFILKNEKKKIIVLYNPPPKPETPEEIKKREAEEREQARLDSIAKSIADSVKQAEVDKKAKALADSIAAEKKKKQAEERRKKKEAEDKVKAEERRKKKEAADKAAAAEAAFWRAHPKVELSVSYKNKTSISWNNVGEGFVYYITIKENDTGTSVYEPKKPQKYTQLNLPIEGLTDNVLYKIVIQSKYGSRIGSTKECKFSLVESGTSVRTTCTDCP